MHLSLSLSVLCRSHVSKTAEMGWRRDVLIFLNHHGASFERNEFFLCFFFLVLQSVTLLFSMVFCILPPPPVTSENLTRGFFSGH
jgi:hypothetical protein